MDPAESDDHAPSAGQHDLDPMVTRLSGGRLGRDHGRNEPQRRSRRLKASSTTARYVRISLTFCSDGEHGSALAVDAFPPLLARPGTSPRRVFVACGPHILELKAQDNLQRPLAHAWAASERNPSAACRTASLVDCALTPSKNSLTRRLSGRGSAFSIVSRLSRSSAGTPARSAIFSIWD